MWGGVYSVRAVECYCGAVINKVYCQVMDFDRIRNMNVVVKKAVERIA